MAVKKKWAIRQAVKCGLVAWLLSSSWLMVADITASPVKEKMPQPELSQNRPERVWVPGWRTGPLMHTPRSGAATVAVDGVIHVIGGVDGKNFLRASEYIRVGEQGDLSEWSPGPALNTERGFFSAVQHKNFVYVVGGGQGDHGKNLLNSVERAEIQPDGTLGEWSTELFKLNTKRRCTKVAVIGSHLYAFGGFGGILLDSVERAEILPDGSLDEWAVLTDTMNVARYIHGVKKVRNRVYMVGGHDKEKGVGITDVEWSQEDSEGWLEPWQFSKPLQTGRYGLATIQKGDYLYALGGLDGAAYLDSIEKAKIDENGNLGAWEFTTPLLSQREGMSTLSLNDAVYVVGGTNLAGYKRSIEYAWFNEKGDIGYWATAKEADAAKAELQKKQEQKRVLPNEAMVLTHLKTARYSYLAVQRDDGLSAWLAGPVTELSAGARIQFPNGVVMRNFFSKELKRNFEVIMFVGELRIVKLPN